ncbi:M14 family metallopeptidase [Pseudomonas rubra]|uniref:M14 family metallopeptidase n=1 Tax=Pseudomonas rubra TaxID=2942627 RepID=A0ABT5PDM2_9PSED|nr:M14 family metallopeptidase [Pseudomonas rubra]MDD1016407.1 M14 family metallopeptidase [Pseudomonas rubra]MDD1036536.1 M14 family metallopeptidase [Pseudomonas rubra]MDD1156552.1 M14 family metallopeptidase [Pseudomonas rubra]
MKHPLLQPLVVALLLGAALPSLAALPSAPSYIDDSGYLPAAKQRILPPMFAQTLTSIRYLAKPDNPLITQAEASAFRQTSNYDETRAYMTRLAAASGGSIVLNDLPEKSAEGHPMLMAIASLEVDKSPAGLNESGKPTIFVEAEIHPGEANGKDAMFMLLRDMTSGDKPLAALLQKVNILFIPTVNVDGDLRRSAYGRINQNGPDETGWRVNGLNYNLNRDFTKLDSAEIRNVAWVFNTYDLSFFADTHSTDGAMYPYDSSYCHNGNGWSPASSAWMDKVMRAPVYQALEADGHVVHECISLNSNQDPSQGYYPYRTDLARFSNQYGDIRNVPSILIEQHALHPYQTQVLGNYVMLKSMFQVIGDQALSLNEAIRQDRERLEAQEQVTLTWKPGKAQATAFTVGDYRYEQSPITGARTIVWSNTAKKLNVPVTGNTEPDLMVKRPRQYVVPGQWREVIARLKAHGIRMTTLDKPTPIAVTLYRMDEVKVAGGFEPDRTQSNQIPGYEGRLLVSGVAKPLERLQTFPAGSVLIDTDQPLGVLAVNLLYPESPDSFWAWGFFNSTLVAAEEPEEYVMEPMARKMLAESPQLKAEFDKKLKSDKAFAASPSARLHWFYERTPFYDVNAFVYPVGAVY